MRRRLLLVGLLVALGGSTLAAEEPGFQLARFSADVTIPLGHRCMGILPTKAKEIVHPLQAHGFVLLSPNSKPVVLVAVDWCEIRNKAYDRWRDVLAKAAGTDPKRVLVSSLHQHDAPVVDIGAQEMLTAVDLKDELCDLEFHEQTLQGVAEALRKSLTQRQPVTHIGMGKAKVEGVASNRRVELNGKVSFGRGSSSGGNAALRDAPEGLIDPLLRTLSFWNGEQPLLALHSYATHPMSYYGRGGVTYDFVGMARTRRHQDDARVAQIYVSGCSGDVTAGKFNDGDPGNRAVLADRLYQAMTKAWKQTRKVPLTKTAFRTAEITLPFNDAPQFKEEALAKVLKDKEVDVRERILAAMALASRNRLNRPIDVPCLDLGEAQVVLLPGESFVGYQLMAQSIRPESFVLTIGYGECWPGYVPTKAAFDDGFGHSWRWVSRGCESQIRTALQQVLKP